MFAKRLADEGRPVDLSAASRGVGGAKQFRIEDNLDGLHCGHQSTVYSTSRPSSGVGLMEGWLDLSSRLLKNGYSQPISLGPVNAMSTSCRAKWEAVPTFQR